MLGIVQNSWGLCFGKKDMKLSTAAGLSQLDWIIPGFLPWKMDYMDINHLWYQGNNTTMDISEMVESDSHEEWWLSWLLSMFLTFSRLRNHDWHVCSPVGSFYRSGNWYVLNCCFPSPKIWRWYVLIWCCRKIYEHMVRILYIYIYPLIHWLTITFPLNKAFASFWGISHRYIKYFRMYPHHIR